MSQTIAIVGAGLSGSIAARLLTDAGHQVTVFEKSGGTGGRLSTRRSDVGAFDHGAQYLTAKSDAFAARLSALAGESAAAKWTPSGKDRDTAWHVGLPGMSGLVKPILVGIDVRLRTRISTIKRYGTGVRLTTEDGSEHDFSLVIVSVPSPQAFDLLGDVDPVFGDLREVVYAPCWAGMFAFRNRIETLKDVVRGDDDTPLGWVARETSKSGRGKGERIVVHGGGAWSRAHLERDKHEIAAMLIEALSGLAGQQVEPLHADAHRWRYARVDKTLGVPFLASPDNALFACGDGCLGGRAEEAFLSGQRVAEHVKALLA